MDDFVELLLGNIEADNNASEVAMKKSKIEDDITPKNPNLIRKRGVRKPKSSVVVENIIGVEPLKPKNLVYEGEIDPLRDTKSFMQYYRIFLGQCLNEKITYDGYGSDSVFATDILDKMIENKKSNLSFLNAWLKWFCDNKLKGDKFSKTKYTSMKALKDTFAEFACSYYIS